MPTNKDIGKVLSLAGGGSWALLEAEALMALFPGQSGHQILQNFDIAIGNSGGAIVLAGLAADLSPKQISDLFRDQDTLHKLYVPTHGWEGLLRLTDLSPRWSSAGKLAGLKEILGAYGARALTDIPVPIAICAYDLDRSRENIFRSYNSPLVPLSGAFVPTLAEAAHASSSAPVIYFDAPATITNRMNAADVRHFWDGGLGSFNLPCRAGLAEAHALGFQDVDVLSLGTGFIWRPVGIASPIGIPYGKTDEIGALTCLARDCIIAPADAALIATDVCPGTSLIHLSPYLRPDKTEAGWAIPENITKTLGTDAWDRLTTFDMDITKPTDIELLYQYAHAWIAGVVPNQPILIDPLTGIPMRGSPTFSEGMATWRQLAPLYQLP